ncbi:hypothetical protein [Synechococcus sp. PROS-9-1]|uniref:hypothetical protein n=1 Tax=Synechococcus sp. PROS-9-1 TaxID=1968775 RepID=UPI001644CB78|nr:hypothetical protein [Synechococcus sp. PROS-9-1]
MSVIIQNKGWQVVLVREHQRALPGEAGSDYKPINVCEHLREIWSDGHEKRIKVGYKWKSGEMSGDLIEAMNEVLKIRTQELPPKTWQWTLRAATYVLEHGMRYDRRNKVWHRGSFCWAYDVDRCMNMIDKRVLKKQEAAA